MGSMKASLRSKDKASLPCCQASGREVRIIHHHEREYLVPQLHAIDCNHENQTEECKNVLQEIEHVAAYLLLARMQPPLS
jgi:hypothetical protein